MAAMATDGMIRFSLLPTISGTTPGTMAGMVLTITATMVGVTVGMILGTPTIGDGVILGIMDTTLPIMEEVEARIVTTARSTVLQVL